MDFELFAADAAGARHVATDHLQGRFPCMVTTRETRSARVNLQTGETYTRVATSLKKPTEAAYAHAERRYKLHELKVSPSSNDAFGLAEMWGEAAKQMLRRDGYLVPMLFLVRAGGHVQMSAMQFEDEQAKLLLWQYIADEVRRSGADGLVFIGETWFLRGEAAKGGVRPSEARRREEAIQIFAAKATGELKSLVIPFSRGLLGRIKLEEACEMDGDFNFFAPVRAVWSGTAPSESVLVTGMPDAVIRSKT